MASTKMLLRKPKAIQSAYSRSMILLIAVFSFLLYANTIPNGYNIDDEMVTINHGFTSKGISAIPLIFKSPYYSDAAGNRYEYRPISLVTFALEHHFFGENAHVSHFINVLIYVGISLILFLTLSKLFTGFNYLLPLTVTMIFVAHPIHTEAVASIKNRDELLCFGGGILALYYSLFFAETNKIRYYLLFFIFIVFALLSKKSIIPFVILIPVTHVFFKKNSISRLLIISLPLSVLAGLFFPSEDIFQKICFASVPIITPLIIHCFVVKKEQLLLFVSRFSITIRSIPEILKNESIGHLNGFKLQWILLPFSLFSGVIFCYFDMKVFIVIYLLISSLVFIISSENTRVYIFYDLIIFILLVSYFYLATNMILLLFTSGLAIYYTSTIKRNLLVALIVIVALGTLFQTSGYINYALRIVALSGFLFLFYRNKKATRLILVAIILGVLMFRFIYSSHGDSLILYLLLSVVLIVLLLYPQLIKTHSPFFFLLTMVPFMISFFLINTEQTSQKQPAYEVLNRVQEYKESIEGIKIIPASGRELNFVEMPLKNSDPIELRTGTSLVVLGNYLQLLVFPHPMGFYYGYAYIEPVSWTNVSAIISLIIHLVLIISTIYFFRIHFIYSFGIFFYLLCIFEFSNFVMPVAGVIADRLAFVASLGFCIAVGYMMLVVSGTDIKSEHPLLPKFGKTVIVFIFMLVLFSAKTVARNFQWKDHVTLMRRDIKYLEKSVQANNIFAFYLVEKSSKTDVLVEKEKYLNEAIIHFKKAVEIYPQAEYSWHDLGQTYLQVNNLNDALYAFLKAAEVDSTYAKAWMKAGGVFVKQNKFSQAAYCYEKVIIYEKNNLMAYSSLSQAYFMMRQFEKSISVNLSALEIVPTAYDPLANLGKTYFTMGDKSNALIYFEKAYLLNPNDRNLVLTIAGIYKDIGEKNKADFYFSRANQIVR